MLDIGMVYDCTPGSGTLAKTVLNYPEVNYVAVCQGEEPLTWLGNVLDREALVLQAEKGSALYEEEVAEVIKRHLNPKP